MCFFGLLQGQAADDWYVRVSYEPRWLTYVVGIGILIILSLKNHSFLQLLTLICFHICSWNDFTHVGCLQLLGQVPIHT